MSQAIPSDDGHHARLSKPDVYVSDSPYSCLALVPISDTDARHMLDFAARWRHGGGGSAEDIFVLYGLSSQVFFERLQSLIRTGPAQHLDTVTVATCSVSADAVFGSDAVPAADTGRSQEPLSTQPRISAKSAHAAAYRRHGTFV